MRWFKHDSDAMLDAKLKRVRIKYGMEGYGLYWYCLELIAQTVEPHNLTFELEHDAEIIAHDTGIHYERVQEMMVYMVELGLFENCNGAITCLKMAARTDEYTQKLLRSAKPLRTDSGQTPDKIPPNRREENREEEKKIENKEPYTHEFESAWNQYPKRAGANPKKKAFKAWNARLKTGAKPEEMIDGIARYSKFVKDTGKASTEFVMQAATFLGPDEHYLNDWVVPTQRPDEVKPRNENDWMNLGNRLGVKANPGESMQEYIQRIQVKLKEQKYA